MALSLAVSEIRPLLLEIFARNFP